MPIVSSQFWILLLSFFLIGGIIPAFYTVGLNYTVEAVENHFMAQANSYFVMMYGIGTIIGPLAGSMMIEFEKKNGYWALASGLCFLFFIVFKNYAKRRK
jgi:MFS family permease